LLSAEFSVRCHDAREKQQCENGPFNNLVKNRYRFALWGNLFGHCLLCHKMPPFGEWFFSSVDKRGEVTNAS
jgi:hypothetical protein